jgi:acetyltransferase
LAQRLMEQTQIFTALRGVRGRAAVDLTALEGLLVRFGRLVVEQRSIKECEINPLLAMPEGLLALDARVVLHGPEVPPDQLPQPAIRPYPVQYVASWTMKDGTAVTLRPIRPEDEPLMVKFHEGLSDRSVYLRYFHMSNLSYRVGHERLVRSCFADYDRGMALVAERIEPPSGAHEIAAVGRLSKLHGREEAEVAVLVQDRWQHRGLGSELLRRLIQIARDEKLLRLVAYMLPENTGMQAMAATFGFQFRQAGQPDLLLAVLEL